MALERSSGDRPPFKPPDEGGGTEEVKISFRDKVNVEQPTQGASAEGSAPAKGVEAAALGNPSSVKDANSRENLHGDWLLVSRNKRPPKSKAKTVGANDGKELNSRKDNSKISVKNNFEVLHATCKGASTLSNHANQKDTVKGIIFNVDASKIWTRKKRQRKEPTLVMPKFFLVSNSKPIVDQTLSVPAPCQLPSSSAIDAASLTLHGHKHVDHGIQSAMNIEIVGPNHVRFLDDPEPPDLDPVHTSTGDNEEDAEDNSNGGDKASMDEDSSSDDEASSSEDEVVETQDEGYEAVAVEEARGHSGDI
ncbi:hypothetical protein SESBI_15331 [Sesbania bispinosa]|nr:hypothetical protein SESBI_15331 [Sesbania bispinosa]